MAAAAFIKIQPEVIHAKGFEKNPKIYYKRYMQKDLSKTQRYKIHAKEFDVKPKDIRYKIHAKGFE